MFPQHHPLTHLSKFNMGLKCLNFISNKLCRNKLCRKIVLSSYDDFTRWGYSWESSSPVLHLTPVYPISSICFFHHFQGVITYLQAPPSEQKCVQRPRLPVEGVMLAIVLIPVGHDCRNRNCFGCGPCSGHASMQCHYVSAYLTYLTHCNSA